jgi:hypothetical protein
VNYFRAAADLNENMNPVASLAVVVPTSPGENYFADDDSGGLKKCFYLQQRGLVLEISVGSCER